MLFPHSEEQEIKSEYNLKLLKPKDISVTILWKKVLWFDFGWGGTHGLSRFSLASVSTRLASKHPTVSALSMEADTVKPKIS